MQLLLLLFATKTIIIIIIIIVNLILGPYKVTLSSRVETWNPYSSLEPILSDPGSDGQPVSHCKN